MRRRIAQTFISLLLCVTPLLELPMHAGATPAIGSKTIVINELQLNGIASGTTGEEFIELKNISEDTIDVSGWKLQYIASTGNLATAKYFSTFPASTVIYPQGFLLITPETYLPDSVPKLTYAITSSFAGLAATGGTVALVTNLDIVVDLVGWGTKLTTVSETELAVAPPNGSSIERTAIDGITTDTDNNKNDFLINPNPTPQTENSAPAPDPVPDPSPTPDPLPTPDPVPDPTPTETPTDSTPTEIPPTTDALFAEQPILLNELFIDPATPLTDANDEWIELYNPNDTAQNLDGYTVFAGATFAYKHVFSGGEIIQPHEYISITSAATSIALANGGGAAKITGPSGQMYDQVTYETAKTGLAWAKDTAGVWQWTTIPTQDTQNIIAAPTVAQAVVAAAATTVKKVTTKAVPAATPKATTARTATKVKGVSTVADEPVLVAAPTPLPVWLLACLGCLAVLYSAYEYRFDIANKIYQFRKYRAARSQHR